eukprot:11299597-Prorocentrum_lima.AAC.1
MTSSLVGSEMCIRDSSSWKHGSSPEVRARKEPPKKFKSVPEPDTPQSEVMTFAAPSTTQMNASWDVVDLVAMVVDVCIQETGNDKSDWDIK